MAQYYSEPNSAITIQQTVAASIGFGIGASNVAITKVSASSPSAITVSYTVTGPSTQFGGTTTAVTAYSNALTNSIASGVFKSTLVRQATTNGATFLADGSVVPQQATVQSALSASPTMVPTATPSFSPGKPTPSPSASPTTYPSAAPTAVPSYGAASPTPAPSVSPSQSPTVPAPVFLYAVQV